MALFSKRIEEQKKLSQTLFMSMSMIRYNKSLGGPESVKKYRFCCFFVSLENPAGFPAFLLGKLNESNLNFGWVVKLEHPLFESTLLRDKIR